jgi:hypothetical protein
MKQDPRVHYNAPLRMEAMGLTSSWGRSRSASRTLTASDVGGALTEPNHHHPGLHIYGPVFIYLLALYRFSCIGFLTDAIFFSSSTSQLKHLLCFASLTGEKCLYTFTPRKG